MRLWLSLILVVIFISCNGTRHEVLNNDQLQELQACYQSKRYFDLRDALLQLRPGASAKLSFYRGVSANKFNRLSRSIGYMETFIRQPQEKTDASLLIDTYQTLGDCFSKTFQYKKAADIYRVLLDKFRDRLDARQIDDFENNIRIFKSLSEVPPQTMKIKGDTRVELVDGGYLPLQVNGVDLHLGLDTGANYSFIIRSLAEKAHMRIIDANIDVHNVAGQIVKTDLGVVSRLNIGQAALANVVFLVFEDRDLYFPEAKQQITGCIGFPVTASLREVTFHRLDAVSIPAIPRSLPEGNLCLDELTPVVAGYYKGRRFAFCLDSGAGQSVLYPPFFRTYEADLKARYPVAAHRVQGLGGFRNIPAYIIKEAAVIFAGKRAVFHDLPVLTDFTLDSSRYFYGNIGRDLIHQFENMTLNFESMAVVFE